MQGYMNSNNVKFCRKCGSENLIRWMSWFDEDSGKKESMGSTYCPNGWFFSFGHEGQ